MVDVKIVLIVLTKEYILATGGVLPTVEYSAPFSPFDLANQLLERYTGIKALKDGVGWVPLLHRPVIYDKDGLYIPYLCVLPEAVELQTTEAQWCPLAKSVDFFTKNEKIMRSI